MKYLLVNQNGDPVSDVTDTGEESLYDHLLSHYPPEFFCVARIEPLYEPYNMRYVEYIIVAPKELMVSCAEPPDWTHAYVRALNHHRTLQSGELK